TASTSSLSRPRAPVSVVTAAVMVGETLATMIVSRQTITARVMPLLSGATGSHDQANQAAVPMPMLTTASVTVVNRTIAERLLPSRSRLIVSPAISAMSVVARPVMACSCDAIDAVITLARYGPTGTPNSR